MDDYHQGYQKAIIDVLYQIESTKVSGGTPEETKQAIRLRVELLAVPLTNPPRSKSPHPSPDQSNSKK